MLSVHLKGFEALRCLDANRVCCVVLDVGHQPVGPFHRGLGLPLQSLQHLRIAVLVLLDLSLELFTLRLQFDQSLQRLRI